MIAMTADTPGTHRTTLDNHAIRCCLCVDTQRLQAIGHDLDAITFLDAQFLGPR